MQEHDDEAGVLGEAQYGKRRLECDDAFCVKVWGFGGLERLVIAEEHEHISRKAAEAEVKVAGFARCILLCEGVAEYVDLSNRCKCVRRSRC